MSGLSILGIVIAIMSMLTIGMGVSVEKVSLFSTGFSSFVVGGTIGLFIGLWLIAEVPTGVKLGALVLATIALIWYLAILKMDPWVTLMSIVPVVGLAVWIGLKLLK